MTQTPIENAYWIIPGIFLAGEYPRTLDEASSISRIKALPKAGVGVFIDLTTPADGLKPYRDIVSSIDGKIECCTFPIPDMSVPGSRHMTRDILDLIDNSPAQGKGICLHCWGGIDRTGTIAEYRQHKT